MVWYSMVQYSIVYYQKTTLSGCTPQGFSKHQDLQAVVTAPVLRYSYIFLQAWRGVYIYIYMSVVALWLGEAWGGGQGGGPQAKH